jgi:hypothetical protein
VALPGETSTGGSHRHVDLVWTGEGYLVAWEDVDFVIQVLRLDAEGTPLGPPTAVTEAPPAGSAGNPRLAWSGERVGLSWQAYATTFDVRFRLLLPDGTPAGDVVVLSDTGVRPYGVQASMAWTGGHFAAVWPGPRPPPDGGSSMTLALVTGAGEVAAPGPIYSWFPEGYDPDVAGRPGGAALVWGQEGSARFATVDADGHAAPPSDVVDPESGSSHRARVACGAEDCGIVWNGIMGEAGGIFFRRVDPAGVPLGEVLRLDDVFMAPHGTSIARYDRGYAVAWQQDTLEPPYEAVKALRVALVPDDGGPETTFVIEEQIGWHAVEPHIVRSGEDLGLVWNSSDAAWPTALAFRRIVCPGGGR